MGDGAPLRCANCIVGGIIGGLRGAGNPTLWGPGQCPKFFLFLDPILGWVNLPMVFGSWFWTRWFSIHGIGCFSMYKYVL